MNTKEFIKWVVHNESAVYSFLRANPDFPQPGRALEEAIASGSPVLDAIHKRYHGG